MATIIYLVVLNDGTPLYAFQDQEKAKEYYDDWCSSMEQDGSWSRIEMESGHYEADNTIDVRSVSFV